MNNTRTVVLIVVLLIIVAGAAFYFMNGNTVSTQSQGAAVANTDSPNITIDSNPAVVAKGGKAQLVWSSIGFITCSIRGATLDPTKSLVAVKGSVDTGALSASTAYTLSCQRKDSTVESKTLNVIVR